MPHNPRKRFGQNFLVDDQIINRIISTISPKNNEIIVNVPKIIVVPMLRKVEETIEGTIIRKENGLKIPPVK